ncbi:hypothetical protein [Corallococcus interemptor]|uniref:hypothetical protein n=1 Tax=Corallococcus interemptor TaxID=2316720 RepID=UPI001ABFF523|nr:hypothetical protein [Corallococcus interemptor]
MSMRADVPVQIVRPDSKGRVTLGALAAGVSSYTIEESKDGTLILHPHVEIPAKEAWIFKNRKALGSVKKGLEQSARGEVKELGSFAAYADE